MHTRDDLASALWLISIDYVDVEHSIKQITRIVKCLLNSIHYFSSKHFYFFHMLSLSQVTQQQPTQCDRCELV